MHALITGGAGFIGSHLARALCSRGTKVTVLDNLSSGNLANLDWHAAGQSLEFVQGDIGDEKLLNKLVKDATWIFHQAAIASVPQTIDEPWEAHRVNLEATLKLLITAKSNNIKRFVFASSSAVYGNDPRLPKTESMPVQPCSPYALQKYASEQYGVLFANLYGIPAVGLRYFNVFGPRQSFNSPYSGVIARFCTAMLKKHPPTIFGDGQQTRDFVYIDNVVNANLKAIDAPAEEVVGRVFNIASGTQISLLDLVEEINHQTAQGLSPEFHEARAGDVKHSHADIRAAQEFLGYQVSADWREGLAHTLDFYRKQLEPDA
jgi:nucleoside-diphosphate-sugar epimerase